MASMPNSLTMFSNCVLVLIQLLHIVVGSFACAATSNACWYTVYVLRIGTTAFFADPVYRFWGSPISVATHSRSILLLISVVGKT